MKLGLKSSQSSFRIHWELVWNILGRALWEACSETSIYADLTANVQCVLSDQTAVTSHLLFKMKQLIPTWINEDIFLISRQMSCYFSSTVCSLSFSPNQEAKDANFPWTPNSTPPPEISNGHLMLNMCKQNSSFLIPYLFLLCSSLSQ